MRPLCWPLLNAVVLLAAPHGEKSALEDLQLIAQNNFGPLVEFPSTKLQSATNQARPIVHTNHGRVVGISDGHVNIFRGIPFAAPPIKKLRWKPPQPVKAWSGILDAANFSHRCLDDSGRGKEDCLFLNVFAPASQKSLPCLLWVHGGAYEGGSANDYDATDLVKFYLKSGQPAVVISTNYRLNIFGFLGSATLRGRDEALGSTGNYGIQDQRAAFRWVQENIAAFGGDPHRVMIFGESAGAGSMTNHLSMSRSAGLFSSVAIESGSFASWAAQPLSYSERVYSQVLAYTGCKDPKCLEDLPVSNLTAAVLNIPIGHCCNDLGGKPWIPWAPTIDGAELMAHPWQLARHGQLNKVPILHGTNLDEGATFEQLPMNVSTENFVNSFKSWYGPTMGEDKTSKAEALYFNKEIHPELPGVTRAWWAAERSASDQSFACSARFASEQLSRYDFSVFQYFFTHATVSGKTPVVYHGAEIPYVFMKIGKTATAEEVTLAEEVASYWYRHAAFGNPNGVALSNHTHWPMYKPRAKQFLQLDVESSGGIRAVPGSVRSETCASFMEEWIDKEVSSAAVPDSSSIIV